MLAFPLTAVFGSPWLEDPVAAKVVHIFGYLSGFQPLQKAALPSLVAFIASFAVAVAVAALLFKTAFDTKSGVRLSYLQLTVRYNSYCEFAVLRYLSAFVARSHQPPAALYVISQALNGSLSVLASGLFIPLAGMVTLPFHCVGTLDGTTIQCYGPAHLGILALSLVGLVLLTSLALLGTCCCPI